MHPLFIYPATSVAGYRDIREKGLIEGARLAPAGEMSKGHAKVRRSACRPVLKKARKSSGVNGYFF